MLQNSTTKCRGSGPFANIAGQLARTISADFFPWNAMGLMLNFAKVGGTTAPSAPVPGPHDEMTCLKWCGKPPFQVRL